jgi:hypothetical protein
MVLTPSENACSEVTDVTMADLKPSRRCDVQVQVPLELCHEDRPRPKRSNLLETGHVRRRDVVLFDERGVEELEELADFIRVHAAVNVLAGPRETRLEVRKRWVEAVHDFLYTCWQVPVHPIFKRHFARNLAQVASWHGLPPKAPNFAKFVLSGTYGTFG